MKLFVQVFDCLLESLPKRCLKQNCYENRVFCSKKMPYGKIETKLKSQKETRCSIRDIKESRGLEAYCKSSFNSVELSVLPVGFLNPSLKIVAACKLGFIANRNIVIMFFSGIKFKSAT